MKRLVQPLVRPLAQRLTDPQSRSAAAPAVPASYIPVASLSTPPVASWGIVRTIEGYAGNLFKLCKVPNSVTAGDFQDFGVASGIEPDWNAIAAWAGHNHPEIETWYDQTGNGHDIVTTATTANRPVLNLERNTAGDWAPVSFNLSNGPSLDEAGAASTGNSRLSIPATVAVQRGDCSFHLIAGFGTNCPTAAAMSLGTSNRTTLMHGANSYSTNPGFRCVTSRTSVPAIRAPNNFTSVILSTHYGASGATSATNIQRISVDGYAAVDSMASITDASVTGGQIGSDGTNFAQMGVLAVTVYGAGVTSGDETLLHTWANDNFDTTPTATKHLLYFGSSTMQDYRSYNNGYVVQLRKALLAAGTGVVATGFGISGQAIATADTAAATVAGYKDPNCTDHTVIVHGGVNDLVSNYTEGQIDTDAEQEAAADTIYASILSIVDKFRANVTVTGKPWRVIVQTQHKRDIGQIAGETANFVIYRNLVLDKLRDRINANPYGYEYTVIDSNSDPDIAAYPDGSGPNTLTVRDTDDIHLNAQVGIPLLVAVALPVVQASYVAPTVQKVPWLVSRDNGYSTASTTVYCTFSGQAQSTNVNLSHCRSLYRGPTQTLTGLVVHVQTNPRTSDSSFFVIINGSTVMTVAIPTSTTGDFRPTLASGAYSATLNDGDDICFGFTTGAGAGALIWNASMCGTQTGQAAIHYANYSADNVLQNTTRYFGFTNNNSNLTQSTRQMEVLEDSTWDRLFFIVAANTLDVNCTIAFQVAGTDVPAMVHTILAGATPTFEDTTGSIAVLKGQLVNIRVTCPAGSGQINISCMSIRCTGSVSNQVQLLQGASTAQSAGTATFTPMSGRQAAITTENVGQIRCPYTGNATLLTDRYTANASTTQMDARIRINAANGTNIASINATTTGTAQDTTHTDTVVHGALLNISHTAPTTGAVTHGGGGFLFKALP